MNAKDALYFELEYARIHTCRHHNDERTCTDCLVELIYHIPMTPVADIMKGEFSNV